ncbi:MAG: WG repeat-containing protein [Bacteroidota bacterium]
MPPQFPRTYHGIEAAKEGQFIVYTPQGAGLVSAQGEVLLSPKYERIRLFSNQKAPYYYIQSDAQTSFIYHFRTRERIHYNASHYSWSFINKRYALVDNKDWIDLQAKKRVFCGKKLDIKILNREDQLLSISLAHQPNKRYIIHFDGRLASTQPYYEVSNYYPEGYIVTALPKPYQQGDSQKMLYGIVDTLGKWVLPAQYDRFIGPMIDGKYFQIFNRQRATSLLNMQGDTLFPFKNSPRFSVNEKGRLAMYYEEEGQVIGLVCNPKNGKLRPAKVPIYRSQRPYENCGEGGYAVAKVKGGEILLNPKGKPVIEEVYTRVFNGNLDHTFIVKEAVPPGGNWAGSYRKLYNCDGSLISFQVDGKTVTNFYDLLIIEDNFYFLKRNREEGHFLFPDGSSLHSPHGWRQVLHRFDNAYILNAAGNEVGIVTKEGTTILPPTFEILYFSQSLGLLKAQLSDENIQWIRPNGDLLFNDKYDTVQNDKAGNFRVKKGDLFGVSNLARKWIIPLAYTNLYYARGFYHGTDRTGAKYRFDRSGELVN